LGLFVGPVVAAIALALVDVFRQANEVEAVTEGVRQTTVEAGDGLSSPMTMAASGTVTMTNDKTRITNE
jgi:hypothetical protein